VNLDLAPVVSWGGDAMPAGVSIEAPAYAGTYSTRETAQRRAERIRGNVAELVEDLVSAWREHDDEALGFDTFADYTTWLFGDVRRVSIPVDARRELVAGMTERDGLSVRKIADALGVSKSLVADDRKVMLADEQLVEARVLDVEPGDEVIDAEVVDEPAPLDPLRGLTPKWRALARVAGAGPDGLTSLELVEVLDAAWETSASSLSKLAAKRLVVAGSLAEARDNRRPYRITDAGRIKLAELLAARDEAERGSVSG
jgi:hypothetical protein